MPTSCDVPPKRRWMTTAAALALVLASACGSAPPGTAEGGPETRRLIGPLCDQLPAGNEPGGPAQLATEPADAALTWIPVLTVFEAAARATGLDQQLHDAEGVTILAPSDGAFNSTLSTSTLDELLLSRHDDLRALLEAHIVEGQLSVAQMLDAGEVTTLSGDTVSVAPAADGMARLADRADTVCADYQVANARIHVISGVLGELPAPAATEEPHVG